MLVVPLSFTSDHFCRTRSEMTISRAPLLDWISALYSGEHELMLSAEHIASEYIREAAGKKGSPNASPRALQRFVSPITQAGIFLQVADKLLEICSDGTGCERTNESNRRTRPSTTEKAKMSDPEGISECELSIYAQQMRMREIDRNEAALKKARNAVRSIVESSRTETLPMPRPMSF